MLFEIRKCDHCQIRFPLLAGQVEDETCPACHSPTRRVLQFSPHRALRTSFSSSNRIEGALLDNIRSTWNVGSMFRTADGAGLRHLYLCGYTPTPDNVKVGKTALGAEQVIAWSHHPDGVQLAHSLSGQGKRLIALEGGTRAEPIMELAHAGDGASFILVVGNEVSGIDPGILEICERVVSLPMMGTKESLNVAVAFGVAVYLLGDRSIKR